MAIEIVRGNDGDARRQSLVARAHQLRARAGAAVRLAGHDDSAIVPLMVGDDRRVMSMSVGLLEQRIFVQGIRPPTVPEGTARLRISLAAGHSPEDIEQLASALGRFT
jgi:7-keto-8-aminopelargonate synthetase-like enzyme